MKLKKLEGLLCDLDQFSSPKVELEQYPTGPHIASRMLYTAENSFGDVSDRVVADFGCGCGTLSVAAALLGAEHVIGIDVDDDSLQIASTNAEELEVEIELVQRDVRNLDLRGQVVDTVIMNPPFGTRKKGADMDFLRAALKVASRAVYSLHKTSTREHIKGAALRDFNARSAEVLCELRYGLPQLYKFHRKRRWTLQWTSGALFPKPYKGKARLRIFLPAKTDRLLSLLGRIILLLYRCSAVDIVTQM